MQVGDGRERINLEALAEARYEILEAPHSGGGKPRLTDHLGVG